jgi:hypothetical protein
MRLESATHVTGRTPQIDLTQQSAAAEREREARYYMRHVVPIYFHVRKGSDERQFVHTAFAFSVAGCWVLMTAGHCITEIERARAAGYELVKCRILDTLGVNAKYTEPVPFDYDAADPVRICHDEAWDYGAMFPTDNTCMLLRANGVTPFDEQWWIGEPDDVDAYFVIGAPAETTTASAGGVKLTAAMARVAPLTKRPDGFCETNAPMFYGELLDNPLSSLKGMSGGPILSFKHNCGDGTGRYWLHAMQVSQISGSKSISGIRMAPLGDFMKKVAEGKHRDLATGAATRPMSIDEIIEDVETLLTQKGVQSKLLHWDLSLNPTTGTLVLDRMQVKDEFEHQGYASAALAVLDSYCDKHGLDVELTVKPLNERTDPVRLRMLYDRHGYVPDPARENVMVRAYKQHGEE